MDAKELQPSGGRNVITRVHCPSTQDIVREEALAGAPAGTVAVTDHQTAGRGRRGRSWVDTPGKALMFSYLARPMRPLAELSTLSLVVGVAVCESLPVATRLRWPNDLVVGGAKVAGILVELVTPPSGQALAIIGIGVNANLTAAELPPTDRLPATSLLLEGAGEVDRVQLLSTLAAALDRALLEFDATGFSGVLDRYHALDGLRGHAITLRVGARTLAGVAAGVDPEGRLLLRVADGSTQAFSAGEVERVLDE